MGKWIAGVVDNVLHGRIKILDEIKEQDKFAILLNKSNGKTIFAYLNSGGIPSTLKDFLRRGIITIELPEVK